MTTGRAASDGHAAAKNGKAKKVLRVGFGMDITTYISLMLRHSTAGDFFGRFTAAPIG
jgi:hypothetical protein